MPRGIVLRFRKFGSKCIRGQRERKGPVPRLSPLLQKQTETTIFKMFFVFLRQKSHPEVFSETSDLHTVLQLSPMGEQVWAGEG